MPWIDLSIFDKIFVCHFTFLTIAAHSLYFQFHSSILGIISIKCMSPFSIFGLVWKGSYSTPSLKMDIIMNV